MAKFYQRKWLWIRLPVILAAAATATGLWLFAWPLPPSQLSITTAGSDGAYYLHAKRYAEKFAAHGITLEIQTSAGSQENLERLRQGVKPSDLAFMQGGFGYLGSSIERRDRSRVETLANVDVEPLWIFTHGHEIDSLNEEFSERWYTLRKHLVAGRDRLLKLRSR